MNLPIGLTIVAWNEGHRLAETIQLHRPLVDQVVVVVQQSPDNTLEVARQYADIVIEHPHYGYCEASRQAASDACACDWQLTLDADERLTPEFTAVMRSLTVQRPRGYRLRRRHYLDGSHHWEGDGQHRFYHRSNVVFLDEIHTEPQAKDWGKVETWGDPMWAIGIDHYKSMSEQLLDERRCQELLSDGGKLANDPLRERKLALNVHLNKGEQ